MAPWCSSGSGSFTVDRCYASRVERAAGTEALQGHGIQPDLHPEHPKMGHLLIAVAREADNLLRRKRGG